MNEVITLNSTNNSSFDLETEEVEIQSGQYWRLNKTTLYKKGTILLIASLNIIDDILHSLELSKHPVKQPLVSPNSDNYTKHRVSYDEFINDFEFVPFNEVAEVFQDSIRNNRFGMTGNIECPHCYEHFSVRN